MKLQEKVSDLNNITSPAWGNLDVTWGAATHTNHTEEKARNKQKTNLQLKLITNKQDKNGSTKKFSYSCYCCSAQYIYSVIVKIIYLQIYLWTNWFVAAIIQSTLLSPVYSLTDIEIRFLILSKYI